MITETLGWQACLYVNVPVAALAALGTRFLTPARSSSGVRLDAAGAVLATSGLVALVLACGQAAAVGWLSTSTLGLFAAGAVLLTTFVRWEARASAPLLPLRILADRNRVGAYLAVAFAVAGMLGSFLLLTYFLQVVLHYNAISAGLSFLPLSAAVLLSSQLIAARLGAHLPPRVLIAPGLVVAAAGMALLTRLHVESTYLTGLLPAEILLGLGIGVVFTPAISTATSGVAPRDAGVAAAVATTAQQVGGSIGTAVLNTATPSPPARPPRSSPPEHCSPPS